MTRRWRSSRRTAQWWRPVGEVRISQLQMVLQRGILEKRGKKRAFASGGHHFILGELRFDWPGCLEQGCSRTAGSKQKRANATTNTAPGNPTRQGAGERHRPWRVSGSAVAARKDCTRSVAAAPYPHQAGTVAQSSIRPPWGVQLEQSHRQPTRGQESSNDIQSLWQGAAGDEESEGPVAVTGRPQERRVSRCNKLCTGDRCPTLDENRWSHSGRQIAGNTRACRCVMSRRQRC